MGNLNWVGTRHPIHFFNGTKWCSWSIGCQNFFWSLSNYFEVETIFLVGLEAGHADDATSGKKASLLQVVWAKLSLFVRNSRCFGKSWICVKYHRLQYSVTVVSNLKFLYLNVVHRPEICQMVKWLKVKRPQFKKEWFSGRIQGATSLSGLWLSYSCAEYLVHKLHTACWHTIYHPHAFGDWFHLKWFSLSFQNFFATCGYLIVIFSLTFFEQQTSLRPWVMAFGLAFKYQFLALPISIYSDVCHCKISAVP